MSSNVVCKKRTKIISENWSTFDHTSTWSWDKFLIVQDQPGSKSYKQSHEQVLHDGGACTRSWNNRQKHVHARVSDIIIKFTVRPGCHTHKCTFTVMSGCHTQKVSFTVI